MLIIVALGDYLFQRYRFKEQLKMSKQEIKEQYKEVEGGPPHEGLHPETATSDGPKAHEG